MTGYQLLDPKEVGFHRRDQRKWSDNRSCPTCSCKQKSAESRCRYLRMELSESPKLDLFRTEGELGKILVKLEERSKPLSGHVLGDMNFVDFFVVLEPTHSRESARNSGLRHAG